MSQLPNGYPGILSRFDVPKYPSLSGLGGPLDISGGMRYIKAGRPVCNGPGGPFAVRRGVGCTSGSG